MVIYIYTTFICLTHIIYPHTHTYTYPYTYTCRQEAKYANDLFKKGKLKIIYIMMDANYHTRSAPDSVNGWLGIMVSVLGVVCVIV